MVTGEQLDHLLAHPGQLGAQLDQHLGGHAFTLSDEAQQNVFGPDVVVAKLQRFTQAQLEDLFGAGVNGMCPDGACWPWPMISSA